MASITDIARRAHVSATTVSRVLNNSSHPVSSGARLRVLKAAEELNYRPDALARAMITRRTKIVAAMVGDPSDPYFSTIIRGIEAEAREHGYLVIVCNTERDPLVERNYLQLLSDYNVDGIVFAGGGGLEGEDLGAVVDNLRQKNVALVALNPHLAIRTEVRVDNVAAARDMTEHLLALGHEHIALVQGPEKITTTMARRQGYQEALKAAGLSFDVELLWSGDFTFESGLQAAQRYLSAADRPTALFAANDQTAIGIMAALRQAGVRVPEDVSVAGFDDIPQARYAVPSLTSVSVPMQELGQKGFRQLLSQLAEQPVELVVCLPHRLMIRESTGPPPVV